LLKAAMNDPRVFFAAERTLLAWTRTSLAIMGFGFVVARFGLYLRMLADHPINPTHRLASTALGVALVLLGVIATAAASIQYGRFIATLPTDDRPPQYSTGLALIFATGLTVLGAILAAYLIIWMNE
jgi:putative membrane protein